jgi:hypothetical protein
MFQNKVTRYVTTAAVDSNRERERDIEIEIDR